MVIAAVTSQLRPTGALGDVFLPDWRTAGLLKPSALKPVFATVEQGLVLRRLGALTPADRASVFAMVGNVLSAF